MTPVPEQTQFGGAEAGAPFNPSTKCLDLLASETRPAPREASGTELTTLDDLK